MTVIEPMLIEGGMLSQALPHWEPREQQVDMAHAISDALSSRGQLLVEAGTGVGKTFGYLIPAIRRVIDYGETIVIATNTITLQEQLVFQDIPVLQKAFDNQFNPVLVKGRANYVSIRRLERAIEKRSSLISDSGALTQLQQLKEWVANTTDGSKSDLPFIPRGDVWELAKSESSRCLGKKCSTYENCFYQQARRAMERGNVLICNHALFFSDLSLRLRGSGFLPRYDHVIFDEAHAIEDVASNHFGTSISEAQIEYYLRGLVPTSKKKAGKGFLNSLESVDHVPELVSQCIDLVHICRDNSRVFFDELIDWKRTNAPSNGRVSTKNIIENSISSPMRELGNHLALLRESIKNDADAVETAGFAQRAIDMSVSSNMLLDQSIDGCVYAIEGVPPKHAKVQAKPVLKCMAVDVSSLLKEHLFAGKVSVVMTSATLATGGGDFSLIQSRVGCVDAKTMQLGSPFDYPRQMHAWVDSTMPEPSDEAYVNKVAERIVDLVGRTKGGAFVLFTSFKMVDRIAAIAKDEIESAGYTFLQHGADLSRSALLDCFREDDAAVLFGTSSFWQGVDVRGNQLRNVIITRLPFDVPDKPLVEARQEKIAEDGGNPFMEDQLPRAVIRFRQGIGRLIRSSEDRGDVSILDSRIVKKFYGGVFLASLPEGVEVVDLATEDYC